VTDAADNGGFLSHSPRFKNTCPALSILMPFFTDTTIVMLIFIIFSSKLPQSVFWAS